jgi:beta-N-acetylhexosaminidase
LAPFFAVTQNGAFEPNTAEGLLVSHIRYRGFQGNIRASTRPVSLDPAPYKDLMQLAPLQAWRTSGGVTFSDSLGVRSVRRFYDPLESNDANVLRRIALDAFLAGNDVLILGNFGKSSNWPEQYASIKNIAQFFRQKYQEDKAFAAQLDAALLRILSLKLKLYGGSFTLQNAQVDLGAAEAIRPNTEGVAAIAQDSVTLLSPSLRDLPAVLSAPTQNDDIVFITDDRLIWECDTCEPYPAIPRTALQEIALELYGPKTTGQVDPAHVTSIGFADLELLTTSALTQPRTTELSPSPPLTLTPTNTDAVLAFVPTLTPEPANAGPATTAQAPLTATASATTTAQALQNTIDRAQWIVISLLDLSDTVSATKHLRNFLAQKGDSLRDKRVVIFAFSAPYHLDATEISKATVYIGVYSRATPYLRAAVQAWFGNLPYNGHLPVSVNALGYSLVTQTAPDPNQLIPMSAGTVLTETQATAEPLERKIGDKLTVRAGPIYDRNGHLVPDNTPVIFEFAYPSERVQKPSQTGNTVDGLAETTIVIERTGTVEIRAIAEPAQSSYVIRVNVGENEQVSIETIKPTAIPTNTPLPTSVPTATSSPQPTTPPVAPPTNGPIARSNWPAFAITLVALLVLGLVGLSILTSQRASVRWRAILVSWSAGWTAYALYAIGSPGTRQLGNMLGWFGLPIVAATCAALVLVVFLVGSQRKRV